MTEPFDPYRKWLGIPAQDQPPHHYRLLGLELFEADADVISNAVDGRMTQIKTFQAGKYSAYSQKILNEIAAARVCLLNPAKKAEYDRQLREQGFGAAPPAPVSTMPPPSPLDVAYDDDDAPPKIDETDFPPTRSDLYVSYRNRKSAPWIVPLILTVILMIVGVAMAVLLKRDTKELGKTSVESSPTQSGRDAVKKDAAKKDMAKKDEKQSTKPPEKKPATVTPKTEPPKPAVPSGGSVTEPKKTELVEIPTPTPKQPEPVLKSKELEPELTEPKEPKKPAPPDEDAQREAEKKIREIFGKDLAAAKTVAQRLTIAEKFAEQGEDASNDLPTRFVFLRMSRDCAIAIGESVKALTMIDVIAKDFDLGKDTAGLTMKADTLTKIWESHRGKHASLEAAQQFFASVKNVTDAALADDDYETALRACKLGVRAAAGDPQLLHDMTARKMEVTQLKVKFTVIRKALDALAADPNDAAANLIVGQWQCLSKEDWNRGLPHLAKGDNTLLADLAKKELGKPEEPKEQLSLADGWWNAAEKEPAPAAKHAIRSHAGKWYEEALPNLAGIDKTKAEKRLEEIFQTPEIAEGVKTSRGGVVQRGNVALASNGTTVTSTGKIYHPENLLDGNTQRNNIAFALWPTEWTITFPKTYQLHEIRFLLWDDDSRFFRYAIAVSSDGRKFAPFIDRSNGEWRSWQVIPLSPARPVKAIKLYGLYNSANPQFVVVAFEAYCIPPATLPSNSKGSHGSPQPPSGRPH